MQLRELKREEVRKAIIDLLVIYSGPSELDAEYRYYLDGCSNEELYEIIQTVLVDKEI